MKDFQRKMAQGLRPFLRYRLEQLPTTATQISPYSMREIADMERTWNAAKHEKQAPLERDTQGRVLVTQPRDKYDAAQWLTMPMPVVDPESEPLRCVQLYTTSHWYTGGTTRDVKTLLFQASRAYCAQRHAFPTVMRLSPGNWLIASWRGLHMQYPIEIGWMLSNRTVVSEA